jgi:hypothetical protein
MTVILDGTGSGNQAAVDAENRLKVKAVEATESIHRAKEQAAFNINTGEITLTTGDESAVLYLKNNETKSFHITAVAVGVGASTGGTSGEPCKVKLVGGVTGGTIVDDATAVDINANRFVDSAVTLTADVYKGAEGKTATGGTDSALFYQTTSGRLFANFTWLVPRGKAVALTVEPPTGNTSLTIYAAFVAHIDEEV